MEIQSVTPILNVSDLRVDDVDAVHAICVHDDLEVISAPEDKPWGVREMHLRHPNGHVFRISAESADDHPHE